jgi:lactoylglutathione lyase
MNPSLAGLVLRVKKTLLKKSVDFYECLGFSFKEEKHDNSPIHYASNLDGFLFELYPLKREDGYPQPHARLSFRVSKEAIEKIQAYRDEDERSFLCDERDYGYVSKDPMGRYVDLHVE